MTISDEYKTAEDLLIAEKFDEAAEKYLDILSKDKTVAGYCNYRLAAISNIMGDPVTAYELYYAAFRAKPDLAAVMYGNAHSNKNYVFKGKKKEAETKACPLCGNEELKPKWCYPLTEAHNFNSFFNPIRLWLYCEPCHHIVAKEFPEKLFLYNDNPREPDTACFYYYSQILDRLARYTSGTSLFEVGIGACECLLAAQEIGFDASGIDVIEKHVLKARDKYGLNVQTADFVEYESGDKKYDIIIMGDVIEHVSDPICAMNKVHDMLSDGGAVWVSTPNFDSAYSVVIKHKDAMRHQQYHLNYFSRDSFYMLLDKCGFVPVDYSISLHYSGSMEVIAVKK